MVLQDVVKVEFNASSYHQPERTEEKHKISQSALLVSAPISNQEPPKYKTGMPITRL
jgi:hypothetical protein